ncbi:MAG: methyltransferase domain-containing protein [Acidobacteriota bacterium]|nr:methyltransferase domain-containing protein [Acidobacteriota bacterium]
MLKLALQTITCLIWIGAGFYILSRPPGRPVDFPSEPPRGIYNPELAAGLDQGLRDFWQQPDRVLDELGSLDGLKVADIGCGEGYFTMRLLDRVGPEGKVYATDIQSEVLETLNSRIPRHLVGRVECILSTPRETRIATPVDVVLVIQVFGEVEDRRDFLNQLKQIMHEDSRLVLIDSKHLTDPENGFTRPLNVNSLISFLEDEGFVLDEHLKFLPKQYFLILRKRSA